MDPNATALWLSHQPAEDGCSLLDRLREARRRSWEEAELAKLRTQGVDPATQEWTRAAKELRRRYREPQRADVDATSAHLPDGWCWATVEETGEVRLGRQRAPQHHAGPNMKPYLRVQNVFEDRIDISDVMEMNFSEDEYERYRLKNGDILLNEGQSLELVGRPAIFRGELSDVCFTNTLVRYRAYHPIDPEFPLLVFRQFLRSGQFSQIASTTTNIAHLGATRFSRLAIPLPSLEEQQQIVGIARPALTVLAKVQERVAQASEEVSALEIAMLEHAVKGELLRGEAAIPGMGDSIRDELVAVLSAVRSERSHPTSRKSRKVTRSTPSSRVRQTSERRPLIAVLSETDEPLTPEQLFARAGYDHDSVEEFYFDLRAAVADARVVETRPSEAEILLGLAKP